MPRFKILIVDDEPDIVETLSFMLQARKFDVVTASSGLEALAKVKSERPDLALLDIMMPGMDGYQTTAAIRKLESCAQIPIIAMTAGAMSGDKEKCLAAGMSGHLCKPFDRQDMDEAIAKTLALQHAA